MAECSESNNKNIQSSKYLSPLKDSNDASIARRSDLGDPIPYPSPAMESSSTTAPTAAPNDGTDAPSRPPVFTSPLSKYEIRELLLEEAGYDCNNPATALAKRTDYLSWDDYFMAIASLSAHRSKDPILPKGACLVDSENRVIGIGYNGFPRGCPDDLLPWQTSCTHDLPFLHTPSPYECHAEVNAILNKCSADVAGARMYVAHFPCNECAKMIAQSRIKEVIYMQDEEHDADIYRASRIMLHMAGVQTRQYNPTTSSVVLDLGSQDDDEVNDSVYATTLPVAKKESKQEEQRDQELRKLLLEEANWNPTAATNHKRKGYLSWDDYFMAMAFLTARRSKDPNTQVGACIVSPDKLILALGYNGFPRGCSDDYLPWARSNDQMLHKKYAYVCHAEVNAILNKGSSNVKDSTLYVALFPCNECAKMIIQAGIKEVVYLQDHYHDTDMCRASRIMFGMAGVVLRRHAPAVSSIGIEFMLTNATETGCTVIQDDATVQEEKKADDGDA